MLSCFILKTLLLICERIVVVYKDLICIYMAVSKWVHDVNDVNLTSLNLPRAFIWRYLSSVMFLLGLYVSIMLYIRRFGLISERS